MVDADHIVKFSHELFNSSLDANVVIVYDLCHVDLFSDGISEISSTRRNLILMDGNRSIHRQMFLKVQTWQHERVKPTTGPIVTF